jgi:hypothetical protein
MGLSRHYPPDAPPSSRIRLLSKQALKKLARILNLEELSTSITKYRQVMKETKVARDHLEHMDERIEIGKEVKHGQFMSARTFRGAMGRFDGNLITFGDESFNLAAINDAIQDVGRTVASALRQTTSVSITVRVSEPKRIERA